MQWVCHPVISLYDYREMKGKSQKKVRRDAARMVKALLDAAPPSQGG
jgi:hypothetical protein